MDHHKEIRQSYLGGFSILLVEGFVWILAGILGVLLYGLFLLFELSGI